MKKTKSLETKRTKSKKFKSYGMKTFKLKVLVDSLVKRATPVDSPWARGQALWKRLLWKKRWEAFHDQRRYSSASFASSNSLAFKER